MQLWSHACLNQSPGSGNVTIAIANLCHSLTSHHACTSAADNEKSWVAQWTTQMVPWVVRNNFGLSDIKTLKPKLYILITKNSDMDFAKKISRFASRTCSWEYLGRPTVLLVAFGDRVTNLAAVLYMHSRRHVISTSHMWTKYLLK